jgi:Family of unknown function (DUF6515)
MRTGVLFAAISIALLIPTYAYGQSSDPRATEEQPEPYHKHHDTRQGHDHFYPDRGSILRDAPQGAIVVTYAGLSYRFHDGVWLEPRGPAFMVVAPPIGLIVPTLPTFATVLAHGGELYLYCNDVYYRPRPDLSGYEVINDPAETAPKAKSDAALAATVSGKPTPVPRAAAPPSATAATTAEDDNGEPAVVTPAAIPVARAVGATPGIVSSAGSAGLTASVNSSAVVPVSAAMRSVPIPGTPSTTSPFSTSSATPSNAVLTSSPTGPATGPPASITVAAATPPGPASVTTTPISTPAAPPSVAPYTPAVPSTTTPVAVPVAATAPVTLPTTSSSTATPDPPKGIRAALSPKNGQTADQLAHDRYDCYRFAVAQTGFDPVRSGGAMSPTATQQQYDYDRAQSACFEARGYAVR